MNFLKEYNRPLQNPKSNDNWDFLYTNKKDIYCNDPDYSTLPTISSYLGLESIFSDITDKNEDQQSSIYFDSHFGSKSNNLYVEDYDYLQKYDLSNSKLLDFDSISKTNSINSFQHFIPSPKFIENNDQNISSNLLEPSSKIIEDNSSFQKDEVLKVNNSNSLFTKLDFLENPQSTNQKNYLEKFTPSSILDGNFNTSLSNISNIALLQRIKDLITIYQDSNVKCILNDDIETMYEILGRLIQRHYDFLQKLLIASKYLKLGSLPESGLFSEIVNVFLKLEVGQEVKSTGEDYFKIETQNLISSSLHITNPTFIKSSSTPLSSLSESKNFRTSDNSNKSYPDSEINNNNLYIPSVSNQTKNNEQTQSSLFFNFFPNSNENNDLRTYDISSSEIENQISSFYGINQKFMNRGSTHEQGKCKPCAFFYNKKKGCKNGIDCEFCHHEDHGKHTLKQWKKQQQKMLDQNKKAEETIMRARSSVDTVSTSFPSNSSYMENSGTNSSTFLNYILH